MTNYKIIPFALRFRTNYFHTEARGYELFSADGAVRWQIRFKLVSDTASHWVINQRSVI